MEKKSTKISQTRRSFLQESGLSAMAAVLIPNLVTAKPPASPLKIEEGEPQDTPPYKPLTPFTTKTKDAKTKLLNDIKKLKAEIADLRSSKIKNSSKSKTADEIKKDNKVADVKEDYLAPRVLQQKLNLENPITVAFSHLDINTIAQKTFDSVVIFVGVNEDRTQNQLIAYYDSNDKWIEPGEGGGGGPYPPNGVLPKPPPPASQE